MFFVEIIFLWKNFERDELRPYIDYTSIFGAKSEHHFQGNFQWIKYSPKLIQKVYFGPKMWPREDFVYNELGYNELGYDELGYDELGYNEHIFKSQMVILLHKLTS